MHDMLDEEFFSADEVGTYKRGRNTKGSKNESLDHMHSTGFEAVIGTLYLSLIHIYNVNVGEGAKVIDSVLMPGVLVEEGAEVYKAIVDEGVVTVSYTHLDVYKRQ